MSDFVEPKVERLPLSGTDRWIEIKHELNAGEYDAMHSGVIKDVRAGEAPILDFQKVASYKIQAYLLDWSLKDDDGKPVPVSVAAIANLKRATRDEIGRLIEEHDAKLEKEIDERKNDDAPESLAT